MWKGALGTNSPAWGQCNMAIRSSRPRPGAQLGCLNPCLVASRQTTTAWWATGSLPRVMPRAMRAMPHAGDQRAVRVAHSHI